jgi:4a-hydroxytetrahydrobiopterin dehydratase
MAPRVFLSYRRSDLPDQATALQLVLKHALPDVSVFVDTESINPSERWPDRLITALGHSSAMVALIGPNWRGEADGTDRFANRKDWVRLELEYALEHKVTVVPVLFGTTTKTAYRKLPRSLKGMEHIEVLKVSRDEHWSQDVTRLARVVASILGTVAVEGAINFPDPDEVKKLAPRLSEAEFDERRLAVPALAEWIFDHVLVSTSKGEVEGTQLFRSFIFDNFKRAFTFMARGAELAESQNHHPDWTNVYNRVDVRLRTFDAGQSVTYYDVEMARAMHKLALQVENEDKIGWPLRPPQPH